MTEIKLAEHVVCTGCGACSEVCPKECIEMKEDETGMVYPVLNNTDCISCHSCEKICPILSPTKPNYPQEAFAAWSNDVEERRTSASGGVAAELYKQAISEGYKCVGASQNEGFSVTHKLVSSIEELSQFKNSKYVFSDAYEVFPEIKVHLKQKNKVLFIGLPCQVAALRKLFHGNENLLLVELVCHGTTPLSYLRQHIEKLENEFGQKATRMSFRDPNTYTYTFTFTLYNAKGERFYAKRTKDGDTYQYGYHRGISYRENCYHCPFARQERNADITIADYHGLGLLAPVEYDAQKVSLILVNNDRGKRLIDKMILGNKIHADKRPVEEPIKGEKQMRHPSTKTKYRLMFEKQIKVTNGDFEKAIIKPMNSYKRDERLKQLVKMPKKILRKFYNIFFK